MREGTIHVAETKDSSKASRLVPFRRSSALNYILEWGDLYVRIYHNRALQAEVVTPFSQTQIDGLRFAQSGDVMFIAHPSFKPRKLIRTSTTTWALETATILGGPFLSENTDDGKSLRTNTLTGTVVITANSAILTEGMVGSLIRFRESRRDTYGKWQGNDAVTTGDRVISRGKVYEAETTATTGTSAPDHTFGTESDGEVDWRYEHSLFGVVEVTNFTSSSSGGGDVTLAGPDFLPDLPDNVTVAQGGTHLYSLPAWSDDEGWPSNVTFYQERLVFSKGQTLYFSAVGDFENFAPWDESGDVTDATAMSFTISDPQVDSIRAMISLQDVLFVGTNAKEFTIGPPTGSTQPFGPSNVSVKRQFTHGSADFIEPVEIGERILFANRSCRRVMEVTSQQTTDRLAATEVSLLSTHLLKDCIFEAAYSEDPDSVYWAITNTGRLIGMTYEPDQAVVAWHGHTIGGTGSFVESVASIPAPDEQRDELYLLVARTVNGQTKRYIERLSDPWDDNSTMLDAVFSDSSLVYSGASTTTVTGLSHLEGETVAVLADGIYVGTKTVSGGSITLDVAATKVVVGLPYTGEMQSLSPDPGSAIGSSQGKIQRVTHATVRIRRTGTFKHGADGQVDTFSAAEGGDTMDSPQTLSTRHVRVGISEGHSRDPALIIRQDLPLPLMIDGFSWDQTVASQ